MKTVVIIPALDPDETLSWVVQGNLDLGNKVIVVDDGSSREKQVIFDQLEAYCTVLHHEQNRGKGEAIKTALRYIKKEIPQMVLIGIMDADGQHLPADMDRLFLEASCNAGALVIGSRQTDQASVPWKSRMGNKITRKVFRVMSGVAVTDTQTGLRAFSSQLLDFMLHIPGSRYEYEMNVLLTCARRNIPILEVPVETIYHDKNNGCSHFKKGRDSYRIYRDIFKFSISSFSSFLLDYGLFVVFTFLLPQAAWAVLTANIAARVLSAGYNYAINCRFVFHEKRQFRTALDYLMLAGLILILNNIVLNLLLAIPGMGVYPAKILTECTLFIISWTVQKFAIFKKPVSRTAMKEAA